jgi:type I restriction enzyme R subunit
MSTQPEAILENNLIKQLVGLGYASVKIHDGDALVSKSKRVVAANVCMSRSRTYFSVSSNMRTYFLFSAHISLRLRLKLLNRHE